MIGGRGFSLSSFVSEFLSFEILFFHIFFSLFIPLIFALWCLIPVGSTAANHCSPFSFPLFLSMTFHLYCCGAVLIGESKIPITVASMLPYICIYVCMYFFFFCSSLPLSWPPSLRMQSTHMLGERSNFQSSRIMWCFLDAARLQNGQPCTLSNTMPWSCAYRTSASYTDRTEASWRVWSKLCLLYLLTGTLNPLLLDIFGPTFLLLSGHSSLTHYWTAENLPSLSCLVFPIPQP